MLLHAHKNFFSWDGKVSQDGPVAVMWPDVGHEFPSRSSVTIAYTLPVDVIGLLHCETNRTDSVLVAISKVWA